MFANLCESNFLVSTNQLVIWHHNALNVISIEMRLYTLNHIKEIHISACPKETIFKYLCGICIHIFLGQMIILCIYNMYILYIQNNTKQTFFLIENDQTINENFWNTISIEFVFNEPNLNDKLIWNSILLDRQKLLPQKKHNIVSRSV